MKHLNFHVNVFNYVNSWVCTKVMRLFYTVVEMEQSCTRTAQIRIITNMNFKMKPFKNETCIQVSKCMLTKL